MYLISNLNWRRKEGFKFIFEHLLVTKILYLHIVLKFQRNQQIGHNALFLLYVSKLALERRLTGKGHIFYTAKMGHET